MAVRMWGGTEVKGTSLEFMEWKQPYSTFLSENGTCVQTLKKAIRNTAVRIARDVLLQPNHLVFMTDKLAFRIDRWPYSWGYKDKSESSNMSKPFVLVTLPNPPFRTLTISLTLSMVRLSLWLKPPMTLECHQQWFGFIWKWGIRGIPQNDHFTREHVGEHDDKP